MLLAVPRLALGQSIDTARQAVSEVETRAGGLDQFMPQQGVAPTRNLPAYTQRFADGELLFRLRDYSRSAVLFTDIVTNYADSPAYSNSLYLLGEALYQAGDRYGARTRFREVLQHAGEPLFRPYVQRSLGRLIEIALRTGDVSGMDELFSRLNQIPPGDIEAQTTYVRGKYYFLRRIPDYEAARRAFEAIPTTAPVYPQARYFLGAIHTAQERFPEAIQAFERVTQLDAQGDEQRQQVIDLAWLAMGRLRLERLELDGSIEAYQQVGRSSTFFDRALFEQAWVFIRNGDSIRAERALEILAISNPDSPLIPEGKLLWGNLLLRTGRFDRAQQVFQEVRTQYGPVAQRLEQIVAENRDPQAYFQQLLLSNIEIFDASSLLPSQALAYVRSEGTLDDSLSVIGDLNTCRQYIRDSEGLIARLNAAINSPSRAHVFRELRTAREQAFQVLNRVTRARSALAAYLDSQSPAGDATLQGIIAQRRGLDNSVSRLPVDEEGVRRRDRAAEGEFTNLGQEIQRNDQRVANLEAMLVAMERYLTSNASTRNQSDLTAVRTEIAQHRAAVTSYRARISDLRRQVVIGRAQVGVGDPRYERDSEISREYRDLLQRQVEILRTLGRLSGDIPALVARLDEVERRVLDFDARVRTVVDQRISVVRGQVDEEERRVSGFRIRLADLERESADVVGGLVMQNINNVRLHFHRVVMRADLGLVDVSWEQRENHNNRARILAEDLNRASTALNDEFSEVIEGAQIEPASGAAPSRPPAAQTPSPTPPAADSPGATGSGGSAAGSSAIAPSPTPAPAGVAGGR